MENSKKYRDDYEYVTASEFDFLNEIEEMENNSEWIPDITSGDLALEPIIPTDLLSPYPCTDIDLEILQDTADTCGTRLMLNYGYMKLPVRQCAKETLCETAKLSGYALGRMNPALYATTLNNGFSVARGSSLLLVRYGKLSSCHSDSDGGYEVMPIPKLVRVTRDEVSKRLGEMTFKRGYVSHSFTDASWDLPDSRKRLNSVYKSALEQANGYTNYIIDFMPVIRFCSSDTSNACATIQPGFRMDNGEFLRFTEGIKVKHCRKQDKSAMTLFQEHTGEIWRKFEESTKEIANLSRITVVNTENCIVGLCRKFNIPKKYGDAAREQAARCTGSLSAHDIYLIMTSAILGCAKSKGISFVYLTNLEESIAKIAHIRDWSDYDVGGTVAWKD